MRTIIYIIAGLVFLAIGPQLILGIAFTVGIYYFLYALFKGITSGSSGGSGGGGSHESDPGDGWHGTGNTYV